MDDLTLYRAQKDEFFRSDAYSPLTPRQQQLFQALRYFEPNPALHLQLEPEIFPEKKNIRILTSTGELRSYIRWGRVHFAVDGVEAALTLYMTPGSGVYFIPFTDATSGTETYGGGRYIEAERLPNGRIHVDFNVAYNPYCAYNEPVALAALDGREAHTWTCPVPPQENRLTVPIRAGEKMPVGDWFAPDHERLPDDPT